MNEGVYYQNTLDSLTEESLTALVNIAEGLFMFAIGEEAIDELAVRGLTFDAYELFSQAQRTGKEAWEVDPFTDYGRAFVNWYMQPREIPVQLDLFGGVE